MFKRILFSAFGAGLAVGIAVAALQHVTTTPLIVEAEVFETAGDVQHPAAGARGLPLAPAVASGEELPDAEPWAPGDGLERTAYSALAAVTSAIGFALILLAAMVLKGGRIDGRTGLAWGACGFAAVTLAPALGLPPELPGNAAAALADRQIWWTATAIATAAGIAVFAFSGRWWLKPAALGLIALPHVIGAPQPDGFASAAPAELAGHFAAASLVVGAVFWVALGWTAATLFQRSAPAA